MDFVAEVLSNAARDAAKYKPITVEKHLELDFDLGTLLVMDNNDLDVKELKSQKQEYLLNLTRDNTQLLLNEMWKLPTKRVDEAIVAELPLPTTVLPRARRVPTEKPLTKWEQFAKEKGIPKKKKDKVVWNDTLNKWVPTYGYKRVVAESDTNWVREVNQNTDPNEDLFAKAATNKSERVAKNELQRLRNIAKGQGVNFPRVGLPSTERASSKQLSTAVTVARVSTASLGKFQSKLPKEKEARGLGVQELISGANRKRKTTLISGIEEKTKNLDVINSILNKRPKIDIEKAVSRQIHEEQFERSLVKQTKKPKAGREGKKRGGGRDVLKGRGGTKPKGGRGERDPGKHSKGRKRR